MSGLTSYEAEGVALAAIHFANGLTNNTAPIMRSTPTRRVGGYGPIREHGLTEAELLDAYSHLAPVDGEEAPDA